MKAVSFEFLSGDTTFMGIKKVAYATLLMPTGTVPKQDAQIRALILQAAL
ncbi:hypothetical protein SDC9_203846 [bioreactor metagenome]|uniref:Uncharacterized protein n=1 Tax=bioreactor metagenome TaxID=1076179 RepID=A0A645IZ36_9ZZZZ|nr:hypothetical protein [Candidatus Pelethousia sp.]